MSSRGITRERQVRFLLEDQDYWCCRAAGSMGEADLVALKPGRRPQLVEVKSTAGGPYERFGPSKRANMLAAAALAGAEAWLCWWPPHGKPVWLNSSEWPDKPRRPAAMSP